MDAVLLYGQWRRPALDPQGVQEIAGRLGEAGGQHRLDLVKDLLADLILVCNRPVHGEELAADAEHGMLPQKLCAELHLVQVLAVVPRRVLRLGVLCLLDLNLVILIGFDLVPFTLDDL